MYGAHLIKNGAMGIVNALIERGWVTHLATNGAGTIHDWELAFLGRTEESVRKNVATGHIWHLGRNRALHPPRAAGRRAAERRLRPQPGPLHLRRRRDAAHDGIAWRSRCATQPADPLAPARAELLQAMLAHQLPAGRIAVKHPWKETSILAQAFRHNVPLTVHPGIGYDIIANHPDVQRRGDWPRGGDGFRPVRPRGGRAGRGRGVVGRVGHHGAAGV